MSSEKHMSNGCCRVLDFKEITTKCLHVHDDGLIIHVNIKSRTFNILVRAAHVQANSTVHIWTCSIYILLVSLQHIKIDILWVYEKSFPKYLSPEWSLSWSWIGMSASSSLPSSAWYAMFLSLEAGTRLTNASAKHQKHKMLQHARSRFIHKHCACWKWKTKRLSTRTQPLLARALCFSKNDNNIYVLATCSQTCKHALFNVIFDINEIYIYMCVCVSSIYRSPPPIPHRSLLDSRVFDVRRIRCWTIARRRVASRWLQSWGNVSMYGQGDAVRCVFSQCGICQPIWKHIHIIQQKHLTGLTIHNCFLLSS